MRWAGTGRVAVQIQAQAGSEPFVAARAFGDDTRLRIDPVDERAWLSPIRGERRRLSRTVLHMRIGSGGKWGRDPVWASFPMVMHRPLPENGVIKWAVVKLDRVGPREEWSVHITVALPETGSPPAGGSGAVAVHLGWLQTDRGLRVASWMDETGDAGHVYLGIGDRETTDSDGGRGGVLSGIRKADGLGATRDKNLDAARCALVAWLRANGMPEWMRAMTARRGSSLPTTAQAIAHLESWRSPGRLAGLALLWRRERFDGDAAAYSALKAWRYHDHHLWEWETSQRTGGIRRRREVFRCFAAKLAATYSTVILDDTNYSVIARRQAPEARGDAQQARANRQTACVSELRRVLVNAFAGRGGEVTTVPAMNLTLTCPECGVADPGNRDDARHMVACAAGHMESEQDKAALLNMLRRAGYDGAVDELVARRREVRRALRGGESEAA